MKRISSGYALIAVMTLLLISTGCDDFDNCIEGNGSLNDYTLDVEPFDRILVVGGVDILISQAVTQEVVFQAQEEVFGLMEHRVVNSELQIDFGDNSCFKTTTGVFLNVAIPNLTQIRVVGASDIASVGNVEFDALQIIVSGSADVALTGSVITQVYDVSGAIEVNNFGLSTDTTSINISGSGNLEVNCKSRLNIDVSGAATVTYRGTPQISQNVSGTVQLFDGN